MQTPADGHPRVLSIIIPVYNEAAVLKVLLSTFFFGITLLSISAIGEYVGRIYEEAKLRPLYILDHVVNLPASEVQRVAIMQPRDTAVPQHELLRLREKVGSSV